MSLPITDRAGQREKVVTRLRGAGCVFAEDEADLLLAAAATTDDLRAMVARRVEGEPLEQVLGWALFCGLRIALRPGVFVPRARTEVVVRQAVAITRNPGAIVLDLCCGSGALGAAVAVQLKAIRLYAADIDPTAVECARQNLRPYGGEVYQGDLFAPVPVHLLGSVDLLLANVPYVPTEAIALLPPEARLYEPRAALDGGDDGLDALRRVAAEAPRWLAPGGHLVTETSEAQAPIAVRLLRRAGLRSWLEYSDELDTTAVIGQHPAR